MSDQSRTPDSPEDQSVTKPTDPQVAASVDSREPESEPTTNSGAEPASTATQADTVPTPAASRADAAPAASGSSPAETKSSVAAEAEARRTRLNEKWGQVFRGVALFTLIGVGLVSWIRLAAGRAWLVDFIDKNQMPMEDRNVLLVQYIGAAVLSALGALAFVAVRRKHEETPATLERWGWFLSPLMLLPATVIFGEPRLWAGQHEDLLLLVLIVAIVAERLFTQCLSHVPAFVTAAFQVAPAQVKPAEALARKYGFLAVVVAGALFYAIFMSYYVVRWHNLLGTATFDLGINNNLLYGGLEGRFNQSTVIFPDEPAKYVANHLKLGLYLFLPIYAVFPDAKTLLVIQSVSLGAGAIPLFLFARRRIPEWSAAVLALAYLAYYPMHGANFYEMKMVPTAAAFALTTIWAIDAKRWVTGGIFFALTLIMREDLPIPLAIVGLFFLLSGHRPRAGAVMAAVAIFWFVLIRFKVMTDAGAWWFPNMYEDLWSEPEKGFSSVIKTLISNPAFAMKHILVEKKFWYLLHLLTPLAFLPLRRWYLWATLVPGTILTLLVTDYDPPIMFSFQYVMHWSPYLFLSAALALAAIAKEDRQSVHRAAGATIALAIASASLSFNYGAFPLRNRSLEAGYHKITFDWTDKDEQTLTEVKKLVASIPRDASVATTERIGAHLSSRTYFYTLRRGLHDAEYVVARKQGLRLDNTRKSVKEALQGDYGIVGRYGEFVVLKKGAPKGGNQELLEEWKLVKTKKRRPAQRRNRSIDKDTDDRPGDED